jgi:uncharacterized membrane protein
MIFSNLVLDSFLLYKNIFSKSVGFHKLSKIVILQPALYHGSIANVLFGYSGFVISKLAKFCLKVSIASSSQNSLNIHFISFSTDLNNTL